MNEKLFILASQKKNTNHILHLILSILTGGLWVIVWIIVAISNNSHNNRIQSEMGHIMHYKAQGLSDVDTYQQVRADKKQASTAKWKAIGAIGVALVIYIVLTKLAGPV